MKDKDYKGIIAAELIIVAREEKGKRPTELTFIELIDVTDSIVKKLLINGVTTHFSIAIEQMKEAIVNDLKKLSKGYCKYKKHISKDTKIPIDVLTVLLKQLKIQGEIEIIMIFSEETGMPNGSGYCLTGNLAY